jgi:hypothetical protein
MINFQKRGIVIDDVESYSWGQVAQFIAGGIFTTCMFWGFSVILFTL